MTFRKVRNSFGEVRHEFEQASGRWQRCGGPKFCRECIKGETIRTWSRGRVNEDVK